MTSPYVTRVAPAGKSCRIGTAPMEGLASLEVAGSETISRAGVIAFASALGYRPVAEQLSPDRRGPRRSGTPVGLS